MYPNHLIYRKVSNKILDDIKEIRIRNLIEEIKHLEKEDTWKLPNELVFLVILESQ